MDKELSVVTLLKKTPQLIESVLDECPPDSLKRRPPSGNWSIHEQVCHLSVSQAMFSERLDRMLQSPELPIIPYSASEEEESGAFLKMDLDAVLQDFNAGRNAFVVRLESLELDQWHRPVEHPEYHRYSIFIMARMAAMHDLSHGYSMIELTLNKDWSGL